MNYREKEKRIYETSTKSLWLRIVCKWEAAGKHTDLSEENKLQSWEMSLTIYRSVFLLSQFLRISSDLKWAVISMVTLAGDFHEKKVNYNI